MMITKILSSVKKSLQYFYFEPTNHDFIKAPEVFSLMNKNLLLGKLRICTYKVYALLTNKTSNEKLCLLPQEVVGISLTLNVF